MNLNKTQGDFLIAQEKDNFLVIGFEKTTGKINSMGGICKAGDLKVRK